MKMRMASAGLSVLLLVSVLIVATPVNALVVTEYALPRASALPEDVAICTDVATPIQLPPSSQNCGGTTSGIFVSESSLSFGNRIALLGPFPSFTTWTEWALPSPSSQPWGIAVSPDGTRVAFTEFQANKVGVLRLSDNKLDEFALPGGSNGPRGIAWINSTAFVFAEFAGTRIGVYNECFNPPGGGCGAGATPALAMWSASVSYTSPGTWSVAVDKASNVVWFTEFGSNRISKMHLQTKAITQYVIPDPSGNAGPTDIAVDRDGIVWVTAQLTNKIFRFNPVTGVFTQYSGLTANSQPYGIAIDNQGKVWFSESATNRIGVLNPGTAVIREISIPTSNSLPHKVAAAVDPSSSTNIIAFAENGASHIGRILEGGNAAPGTVTTTTNFLSVAVTSSLQSSTTSTSPTLSDVQTKVFATSVTSPGTSFSTTMTTSQSAAASTGTSITDTLQILLTSTSAIVTSFIATTSGVLTTTSTSTLLTTSATTTTTATATSTTTSLTTQPLTATAVTSQTQPVPFTQTLTGTAILPAPTPIPGFPPWALALGFLVATIGLVARRHRRRRG